MVEMHLRLLRDECNRKAGIWDAVNEELTRLEKQVREKIANLEKIKNLRKEINLREDQLFLDQIL